MKTPFRCVIGLGLLSVFALLTSPVSAQIIYVDATAGVSGNTALAAGGTFTPAVDPTATGSDNLWRSRAFGSSASIFEASGQAPATDDAQRLVTTLTGVADGTYNIYLYFWSPGTVTADNAQQWLLRGGLVNSGSDLTLYSRVLGILPTPINPPGMVIADQVISTAGFTVAPTLITEGGRNLWQANLGQAVVSGGAGTIQVFVDDYAAPGNVNNRSWYDGVGYGPVPEPSVIALSILGLAGLAIRRGVKA